MTKKNLLKVIGASILLVALASCGAPSSGPGAPNTPSGGADSSTSHKIIYHVDYTIYDNNFHKVASEISTKANELEGYVLTSKENLEEAHYVFKIPTKQLDIFISFVDTYNVGAKNLETTDVTDSYDQVSEMIKTYESQKSEIEEALKSENLDPDLKGQLENDLYQINRNLTSLYAEQSKQDSVVNYSSVNIDFYKSRQTESDLYWNDYFYYLKLVGKGLGSVVLYSAPFALIAGGAIGIAYLVRKKKKD